MIKGSHCSYCGARFAEQIKWPRRCWTCHNDSYANPLPVVAILIPCYDENGVIIQQRNIEPQKGQWALPSGYIDLGESWQEACAREVQEEMGIVSSPEDYEVFDVGMGNSNGTLVVFARHVEGMDWNFFHSCFSPNSEVQAVRLVSLPVPLAFPTHTSNLKKFFQQYL